MSFKEEKICIVEVVLFRYEWRQGSWWRETPYLQPQEVRDSILKLSIFLHLLQDRVIWSPFTEKL